MCTTLHISEWGLDTHRPRVASCTLATLGSVWGRCWRRGRIANLVTSSLSKCTEGRFTVFCDALGMPVVSMEMTVQIWKRSYSVCLFNTFICSPPLPPREPKGAYVLSSHGHPARSVVGAVTGACSEATSRHLQQQCNVQSCVDSA